MPTTVFRNGSVYDGRSHLGEVGAVVVTDDRVVAVLPDPEDAPPADRTVDLAGGLLAPGFVDAHVHTVQGGLERIRCDLSELGTREDYLVRDRGVRRSTPGPDLDPRRRLGDGGIPGRHADRRRSRHSGR